MARLHGLASHHLILRNFGCPGRLTLLLHHQTSWLPQHRCWSLQWQNPNWLDAHHLQGIHHQSQPRSHHWSHCHLGMLTCCLHGLCHWILLVILMQLHGNWCWTLSGSGTLPGRSCEVDTWSRIWPVRTLMNVEPLSPTMDACQLIGQQIGGPRMVV